MDLSETYYKMCYEAFPEDREDGNVFKTQDQLQEMYNQGRFGLQTICYFIYDFATSEYGSRFTISGSMDQLWLAFYMKEKNKIWDGEKWLILMKTTS